MRKIFRLFCLSLSFVFVFFSVSCDGGGQTNNPNGGQTNNSNTIDSTSQNEEPVFYEPVISSLDPASRTMGDPDFTLTVNGSYFVASSIIRWDGFDCPTTFVSNTQLTTIVPAESVQSEATSEVSG